MELFDFMICFLRLHRSNREEGTKDGKTSQEAGLHCKNVQAPFYGKGWLIFCHYIVCT